MRKTLGNPRHYELLSWLVVALIYIGLSLVLLSNEAHAGTVADTHTLSWTNPTTRIDGEPIVGEIQVTAHCYRDDGTGTPVALPAEPQAESVTFIPRDLGMSPGDWLCYGIATEAGNTAGPSEPSDPTPPFALTTIPDAPPNPPAMRQVVAQGPNLLRSQMIAMTRLHLRPSD